MLSCSALTVFLSRSGAPPDGQIPPLRHLNTADPPSPPQPKLHSAPDSEEQILSTNSTHYLRQLLDCGRCVGNCEASIGVRVGLYIFVNRLVTANRSSTRISLHSFLFPSGLSETLHQTWAPYPPQHLVSGFQLIVEELSPM